MLSLAKPEQWRLKFDTQLHQRGCNHHGVGQRIVLLWFGACNPGLHHLIL